MQVSARALFAAEGARRPGNRSRSTSCHASKTFAPRGFWQTKAILTTRAVNGPRRRYCRRCPCRPCQETGPLPVSHSRRTEPGRVGPNVESERLLGSLCYAGDSHFLHVKGSPEKLTAMSTHMLTRKLLFRSTGAGLRNSSRPSRYRASGSLPSPNERWSRSAPPSVRWSR